MQIIGQCFPCSSGQTGEGEVGNEEHEPILQIEGKLNAQGGQGRPEEQQVRCEESDRVAGAAQQIQQNHVQ